MQTVVSMPVASTQPVQVVQRTVQSPVQSVSLSETKPVTQSVPQLPVKPVEDKSTSLKEHTESLKKSNFSTDSDVCLYGKCNE